MDKLLHLDERLEKYNEEFNNFMHRVNEVSGIVHKLASDDKEQQQIGCLEADRLLSDGSAKLEENFNEDGLHLKVKSDRTILNRRALAQKDPSDESTMSQEAFMEEVSRDADRRYKEKLVRKERSETFKKQAVAAFKRGEYETSLTRYNKAIEQIKDNCALYLDRAVVETNLKLYEKAIEDCNTALRLNEDSLRAHLLLAKAFYLSDDIDSFTNTVKEAKEKHPKKITFIEEFIKENIKKVANE